MNDERTHELLNAYRAADDRCQILAQVSPGLRTVTWLCAISAVFAIVTGSRTSDGWWSALFSAAGLLAVSIHVERIHRAGNAAGKAWDALTEHTGLDEAGVARLVDGQDDGGAP